MSRLVTYLFSSVGQKKLMALSGLGWGLFALSHMAGNLLVFVGSETYNKYGHAIVSNPAIYVAEAGLVLLLLTHVFYGIRVSIQASKARSQGYVVKKSGDKEATLSSRTMKYTGIAVLGFIILHLWSFKYGAYYEVSYDGVVVRDLFRLMLEKFESPIYTWGYVAAVILIGFHLSHGVYSALQSLGINHPRYTPIIEKISVLYGILIAVGFASQPIYVHFVF